MILNILSLRISGNTDILEAPDQGGIKKAIFQCRLVMLKEYVQILCLEHNINYPKRTNNSVQKYREIYVNIYYKSMDSIDDIINLLKANP